MNIETRISREAAVEILPTGAVLGAELRGVDLKSLDDSQFAAVLRAFHDHQVILIRNQALDDKDLIAFSRRFGDLDWAPVQETGRRFVEGLPEIYIVSNVKVNGEPIGSLGAGEAVWHTDMSYLEVPPMASVLYALEDAAERRQHVVLQHVCDLRRAARRAEAPDRRPEDQARRHLQQRRLPAPGRDADRRSHDIARAPCIRWSARIPTPGGRCSISAAAATPI